MKHTPGPWHVFEPIAKFGATNSIGSWLPGGETRYLICETLEIAQDEYGKRMDAPMGRANARLIAAAVTSYDKHFGPRAVEAAEADLLGEFKNQLNDAAIVVESLARRFANSGDAVGEKYANDLASALLSKSKGVGK